MVTRQRDFLIITVMAGVALFAGHLIIQRQPTVIGTLLGTAVGAAIYVASVLTGRVVSLAELRGIAAKLGAGKLAFWR